MIYGVNCHKTFTITWAAIKGWIDPMVVNKVQIHNTNTCDGIRNTIAPDQLLEEYGGNSKWPGYFWPPYVPNARPLAIVTEINTEDDTCNHMIQ
jgi:hypothetical protein